MFEECIADVRMGTEECYILGTAVEESAAAYAPPSQPKQKRLEALKTLQYNHTRKKVRNEGHLFGLAKYLSWW
jgi:hypothetical protein